MQGAKSQQSQPATQGEFKTIAREAIKHAHARRDHREAGRLGELFGLWKRSKIGNCMMRNAAMAELSKS